MRDWLAALAEPYTYRADRNLYTVFGFLWGVPIPFASVLVHALAVQAPLHPGTLWEIFAQQPIHWVFALHPLLFAVVFGAMGTVKTRKETEIHRLMEDLCRAVDDLAAANQRLRELDAARQRFIADVTHNLRTPLVAIHGYLEMILDGRLGSIVPEQRRGLETAARNARRLKVMIQQLLDLARAESGALVLERRPCDLTTLLIETADSFRPEAQRRAVCLETVLPAGPVVVRADRERLAQVLGNLADNALKHTPAGGTVRLALGIDGIRAHVRVEDTGPGIAEEVRRHLFERFVQGDRRAGGAGLGLSIVKAYLDAHGAPPQVDSNPGRGTTVSFTLAIDMEVPDEAATHPDCGR